MDTIQWENIDINQFSVFIRDLSESTNANIKYMIEDLNNENKQTKNMKKQKKMKKKDLIIQEQNRIKMKKRINDDRKKLPFLFESVDNLNPYPSILKLATNEIRNEFKFKLLQKYWLNKKKYLSQIFILYYHMKDSFPENELIQKIQKTFMQYDCKTYMLQELGHLLPPLNFWNQTEKKLDPWQIETIKKISNRESCLIRAPTSSGKTFIAMATGIIHKKILYVCPAKPVAYQVGSHYKKMGYNVCYLLENHFINYIPQNRNIFIGTPDYIENNLYKIGTSFDYAVFDEIHNLNQYDMGLCYENIIKLISCNFLALSATIENIDFLKNIFQRYHSNKKINLITYDKRFINQQRWIYNNNSLIKLHPCICLDVHNFNNFNNISFTPNDCIVLYEKICETFENFNDLEDKIDALSPDEYFKNDILLTLDNSKEYECYLKKELHELYSIYPEQIKQIILSFEIKNYQINTTLNDIVDFFIVCKSKELLPMIYFHTNQNVAYEIFTKLDDLLYQKEKQEYPFHYMILEKKKELYDQYLNRKENYSSKIKITSKNAIFEKQDKLNEYDKREKQQYISTMIDYYESLMKKCNQKQKINLENELHDFIKSPNFSIIDEFRKHQQFCFTSSQPMSASEIRNIRREIRISTGLNIDYESPLFQLLKRGIGLYIESMPDKYNWILQKLMSQKKLGIIISSRILCLGIDLPIRSIALSGYKNPNYTTSDFLQMSGRAGRRGHDNQGNIIFHNVSSYKELMVQKLPKIEGSSKPMTQSYTILKELNKNINISPLLLKTICEKQPIENKIVKCFPKLHRLLWNIRYFPNSELFIQSFNTLEKKIFLEDKREYYLFNYFNDNLFHFPKNIIHEYKSNKITNEQSYIFFIQIGNVCRDICNSLPKVTFKLIIENCLIIFNKCKDIVNKYYCIES